jgi:hypothetical protein
MLAVTPSDDTDMDNNGTLWIGTAGDITFITQGGDTQTVTIPSNGYYFDMTIKRVKATGTTATDIYICFN